MSGKSRRDQASTESVSTRRWLHEIIFEADTPLGKLFDEALLVAILFSVALVLLESIKPVRDRWGIQLDIASVGITVLFTIEYILRVSCVRRPLRYVYSFFGIVDLLAIVPGYFALFVHGPEYWMVLRSLRLLRVFHVFKMGPYVAETKVLVAAILATRVKIIVFLMVVVTMVLILGTAIYVVENPDPDNPEPGNKFTNIPISVYWAIVTVTTVGYGDMAPQTILGQFMAALAMLIGYSMIIVPVAIFSVEVIRGQTPVVSTQACPSCSGSGHDYNARYCKYCGESLA
ncbi:MAG: ion transporter [Planctomycetaceae bacterium]|nr:ion transporter [Planctomycetaceae bacterium]